MNIRDLMIYSKYLLLFGVVWALASCQREDKPLDVPEDGTPIELSASSEWPTLTKATDGPINNLTNLVNDGIVVWAGWTKAANDNSTFVGEYSTGATNLVFGENGTKVYYDGSSWDYSPKRFWHSGSYTFAAAVPASAFNATYANAGDLSGKAITGSILSNNYKKLNLTFATDFNLATNQKDIMVAFCEAPQSNSSSTVKNDKITFKFEDHQLAMVNLQAKSSAATEVEIEEIKIYGNSYKASSVSFELIDSEVTPFWVLDDDNKTRLDNVYKQATKPTTGWVLSSTEINLLENLLVFPENLTADASPLYISVKYSEKVPGTTDSFSTTKTQSVKVNFEAGKIYTYLFEIGSNGIIFGNPKVSEWEDGGSLDNPKM